MVLMNEVQEGEVRAQPVRHVVHAVLGLLVQGLCPRDQCLVYQVVIELGVSFL